MPRGLCNAPGVEGTLSISDVFQHDSKQLHWDVPTLGHTMLEGGRGKKKKKKKKGRILSTNCTEHWGVCYCLLLETGHWG